MIEWTRFANEPLSNLAGVHTDSGNVASIA